MRRANQDIAVGTGKKITAMFSGIVEETATVVAIEWEQGNMHLTLSCSFVGEMKIDQSVSHNGVCLTVVKMTEQTYTVTAIRETLECSNLGLLKTGDLVNIERSMLMNGRLDGHIVQGHVDQTAICTNVVEADGSWYYTFEYEYDRAMAKKGYMTVEKGSVCVNGVSLTVCNSQKSSFEVAIIPYTYHHTNFCRIETETIVNLEFDIIGKYLSKLRVESWGNRN
jgi:riboflavin synthase